MIVRVKTLNNHLRCRQALKSQPGASLAACKLAFVRSSLAGALILSSTSRGCYFVRQSVFGNPSAMLQEALNTYIRKPNAHEPALFMSTKNTAQPYQVAAAVRTTQPKPNFCSLNTVSSPFLASFSQFAARWLLFPAQKRAYPSAPG